MKPWERHAPLKKGSILYKDNRYTSVRIWDQPRRIPTMAVYGFKMESNGILNRNRLEEHVYEAFRYDVFMLMGTPDEIWATVRRIENARSRRLLCRLPGKYGFFPTPQRIR